MKQVQIPLSAVQVGETILKIGNREVNARFVKFHAVQAGQIVRGPRGGRYELTNAGAANLVKVETTDTGRPAPIVAKASTATVLRSAE
jgi:hypothetical protein